MKARHIKNIRIKLKDEKFLIGKLREWGEEEKRLESFYRFKCSDFFEGKTLAEINRQEYYKRIKVCNRKIGQLKRLLKIQ